MSEPLSPKELAALRALMSADTIAGAAVAAGVDERTVRRYLQRPEFKAALREAQLGAVAASTAYLADSCGKAVKALVAVIEDAEAPHAAVVAAARALLTLAHEAIVSADLAERLEKLEQASGGAQ